MRHTRPYPPLPCQQSTPHFSRHLHQQHVFLLRSRSTTSHRPLFSLHPLTINYTTKEIPPSPRHSIRNGRLHHANPAPPGPPNKHSPLQCRQVRHEDDRFPINGVSSAGAAGETGQRREVSLVLKQHTRSCNKTQRANEQRTTIQTTNRLRLSLRRHHEPVYEETK